MSEKQDPALQRELHTEQYDLDFDSAPAIDLYGGSKEEQLERFVEDNKNKS